MPAATALLTLFLVGGSGTSPAGRAELSALDQPSDPPAGVTGPSAGTSRDEGWIGAAGERDTASARLHRATLGGFTQRPIVRGAAVGAILGAVIGLLGGAVVGAVMGGVVRSLP